MSAHTPGPWIVSHAGSGKNGKFVIDELYVTIDGADMAIAADIVDPVTGQLSEANARLIAAAPELLDACKLALFAFETNAAIDWSTLEATIAKATTPRAPTPAEAVKLLTDALRNLLHSTRCNDHDAPDRYDACADAADKALALTAVASEDAPFGYVVRQPDGHETYMKADPTAFRANGYPELGFTVHALYDGPPAARPAPVGAVQASTTQRTEPAPSNAIIVNVLDFIPEPLRGSVVNGTNTQDLTQYFQNAMNAAHAATRELEPVHTRFLAAVALSDGKRVPLDICHVPDSDDRMIWATMQERGYVDCIGSQNWALTSKGRDALADGKIDERGSK